jgi:hypothetical protein
MELPWGGPCWRHSSIEAAPANGGFPPIQVVRGMFLEPACGRRTAAQAGKRARTLAEREARKAGPRLRGRWEAPAASRCDASPVKPMSRLAL